MSSSTIHPLHQRGRDRVSLLVLVLVLTAGLAGCSSQADPTGTAAAPSAQNSAAHAELDGTYAVTWEVDELAEAVGGAENPEAQDIAEENAGTVHLVFASGSYDLVWVEVANESCPGSYELDGDRIVATATIKPADWNCGDGLGEKTIDATWQVNGNSLTLTDWALPEQPAMIWFNSVLLGAKPLERVDR